MNLDLPELTPEAPQGALCQVKVSKLKPTQNAVGFDEVNDKIARYSAKSKEDLRDYLLVHPVPVVIGNGGNVYLTDHHHMANALWKAAEGGNQAGINSKNARVVVTVQYNRHGLMGYHFWKEMHKLRLVYLFDNAGGGPIRPKDLCGHIQDLANDPYRSLAWAVRQRYGYAKSPHAFAEFLWANFFRIRIVIDNGILSDKIREEDVLIGDLPEEHRKEIIDEAMYLARSREAAGMPGYLGSN